MPPTWFFLSLLAVVAAALVVPAGTFSLPAFPLVGATFIVLGLAMNVIASRQFERKGIAIRPGSRAGALATEGLFRVSRNPMYLAWCSLSWVREARSEVSRGSSSSVYSWCC
jgi:protein-S-isoprenylcysteine O-methyltransferase Ste14